MAIETMPGRITKTRAVTVIRALWGWGGRPRHPTADLIAATSPLRESIARMGEELPTTSPS